MGSKCLYLLTILASAETQFEMRQLANNSKIPGTITPLFPSSVAAAAGMQVSTY